MKNLIIFVLFMVVIFSVNAHHCSILKLNCNDYCYQKCGNSSLGDSVVCEIIQSICKIIGCCHAHSGLNWN